jgi:hypothetical protein
MRLELPSTSAQVDYYTTDGTWTLPPGARIVQVLLIGGGGAGATGRRGAAGTNRFGGGGGQGGFLSVATYPADVMPETVDVVVGTGGIGRAGVVTDNTDGRVGDTGVETSFGTLLIAGGGSGGGQGTAVAPGVSYDIGRGHFEGGWGAGDNTGFASTYAGGGGGAGGHIGADTPFGVDGFLGGGCGSIPSTYVGVNRRGLGTAGPAPLLTGTVGHGVKGADSPVGVPGSGGPGGAGGNDDASAHAAAGGDGADGCLYGGGGGGGGASQNGYVRGRSGAGASGIAVVTTYF